MPKEISVAELEKKILEIEEITVVIRAPSDTRLKDYPFERKAAGNTTVSEWKDTRLNKVLEGKFEAVIIDGGHVPPHGRTKMDTLRKSYEK
jgi:hypothetical protein